MKKENEEKKDKLNSNLNETINLNISKEDNGKHKVLNNEDIEKIFFILINNNIYKNKKTNIDSQSDYEIIVNIFSKLNNEEFILLVNNLNNRNIPILKIIINGLINPDFSIENQEDIIIEIISKIINIYLNKDIFYFIYEQLSIIYRKHKVIINDINSIRNFEKIFNVWKLLYNIETFLNFQNQNLFFFKTDDMTKNIVINFGKKIKIGGCNKGIDRYFIIINLIPSKLFYLNKYNKKFTFIKLYNMKECEFEIKYNDVFNNNNENDFGKINNINKIEFELLSSTYKIIINDEITIERKNINFDFNLISKLEILNNFIGEISSIEIKKYFLEISDNSDNIIKHQLTIEIKKEDYKIYFNVFLDKKKKNINKHKDIIIYDGEIFSDEYNNKILKKYYKMDLTKLKYYGGFDCFIPIFKIINYIIKNLINNINNNQINKENSNNKYINKSILWIKDILKIILKMICLSEENYINFQKIVVSLIGSIAEIMNTLTIFYFLYINIKFNFTI